MVAALRCVRPQFQWCQLAYATEIKSIQLHDSIVRLSQKVVSFTFTLTFTYKDATGKPYGYLLVDLTQSMDDRYRLRTKIFPGEVGEVFVPI